MIATLPDHTPSDTCPCCNPLPQSQSRRQFLAATGAVLAGGMIGFVPGRSMAASVN
jgi:hypothetical protein